MVMRGSRLASGSWKTIWNSLRSLRSSRFVSPPMIAPAPHDGARRSSGSSAQHRARERGLAAAGFADDAQRLALLQREADAVDRAQRLVAAGTTLPPTRMGNETLQVLDVEQRRLRFAVGERARIGVARPSRLVDARHRVEQHARVGVPRAVEDILDRAGFHERRLRASPARGRTCPRSRPCRG